MSNTTRTRVSKANPSIKAIVGRLFPTWTGRKVAVLEVDQDWAHTDYVGDQTTAFTVWSDGTSGTLQGATPQSGSRTWKPTPNTAIVMRSRFQGEDMGVEIVVLRCAHLALDGERTEYTTARMIAGDALEAGDLGRAFDVMSKNSSHPGAVLAAIQVERKSSNAAAQVSA